MKKFTKVIALILSLTLLLCFPIGVSAAEPEDTGVDTAAKGSLTIYKVDLTNAKKDGAWDSSYVSTGVYDQIVNDTLTSYALKDVEFTYLRVADVVQLTGSAADGVDSDHVETLYGISKTAGADLLNALGLENGANRYEKADGSDQLGDSNYYYQSDTLISALSTALKANATTVKNALEAYVTESGTAMPLTDTYGKTKAENLELGLYLVVETKVPEMVTSTCNPFFVCLPMTSSGGSWIYDVTVYPKNLTGNPTLDKTLRESKDDTGKHNGSGSITDGYADTGTASDGDSVDYQIISTLPRPDWMKPPAFTTSQIMSRTRRTLPGLFRLSKMEKARFSWDCSIKSHCSHRPSPKPTIWRKSRVCMYLSGCTTARPAEASSSMPPRYINTPREIMRSRRRATTTCDAPVPLPLKKSRWMHPAKCRTIIWTPSNRTIIQS